MFSGGIERDQWHKMNQMFRGKYISENLYLSNLLITASENQFTYIVLFRFHHIPAGYKNLKTMQEEILGKSGQNIS